MIDILFQLSIKHKKEIISFFFGFYFLIISLLFLSIDLLMHKHYSPTVELAKKAGELASLFFIITLVPGIARRFHIQNKLITIVMLFRRYLGISVFFLAMYHSLIIRIIPSLLLTGTFIPNILFEFFGTAAILLLFPVFITSNDYSVARLGVWWKRIHALVYVIIWLVFIHVALQELGTLAILLFTTALLELFSLLYMLYTSQKKKMPPDNT